MNLKWFENKFMIAKSRLFRNWKKGGFVKYWFSRPKEIYWKLSRATFVKYGPVAEVTKISSVVLGSPEPSSQSSSSSQDGRSWIFSLCSFGLNVVGNRVGATYTGVMMSSGIRSDVIIKTDVRHRNVGTIKNIQHDMYKVNSYTHTHIHIAKSRILHSSLT